MMKITMSKSKKTSRLKSVTMRTKKAAKTKFIMTILPEKEATLISTPCISTSSQIVSERRLLSSNDFFF